MIHTEIGAWPPFYLHRHCPHPCHVKAKVWVSQKLDFIQPLRMGHSLNEHWLAF